MSNLKNFSGCSLIVWRHAADFKGYSMHLLLSQSLSEDFQIDREASGRLFLAQQEARPQTEITGLMAV